MSDKTPLTPRQSAIIRFAKTHSWFSASDVATIATNTSPATLRRDLSTLAGMGLLEKKGENKGVKYALTEKNHLFLPYVPRYPKHHRSLILSSFSAWKRRPEYFAAMHTT